MKKGAFIFWSVFIAAAGFRLAGSFERAAPDASACLKQVVSGSAIIAEDPSRKESGQVFIADVHELFVTSSTSAAGLSRVPCAANILVRVKTKLYPRFTYGDEVMVTGKLAKPFNFSSESGRSFDYQGFLAKDDVYYEMKSAIVIRASTSSASAKLSSQSSPPSRVTSVLYSLKRGFVGNLERALGEPHAALAAGLVVGEKAALGADLLEDFRIVGLIHIVVLSGFNITIVGVALRRTLSSLPRAWGIVLGGVAIMLFGVLVGGGATVIRSCFMAGVALIADLIRRDYSVGRALAFAALIMLIQNPLILLHDPSFQLSFLATLGLILLAGPIESRLPFITEKLGMRGTVATCLATQIFVSPYILYMMGQTSLIGIVVNIIVLPLIPLTMLFVFLTGAIGFVSHFVATIIGWGAHLLLSYELFMVENFARVPYAAIEVPKFSGYFVVIFYVLFFLLRNIHGVGKAARSLIMRKSDLCAQFEALKLVPRSRIIDYPETLIATDFCIHKDVLRVLAMKKINIFFTRRSLKHLAEKSLLGERLLGCCGNILEKPDSVHVGDHDDRVLFVKAMLADTNIKPYIASLELDRSNNKAVVVTIFIAKEKYLKDFKILWRTAYPPSAYSSETNAGGRAEFSALRES